MAANSKKIITVKKCSESAGLLTTVAELPFNYKIRYVAVERPLDLTVKTTSDPVTSSVSPQRSPFKKRPYHYIVDDDNTLISDFYEDDKSNVAKQIKKELTPKTKIVTTSSMPTTHKSEAIRKITSKEHKRLKAVRKLKFDEKKSSPVSGTIIRALDEIDDNIIRESGDIDPEFNIVEVTEEAKAELAAIPNIIGAYTCKLCQIEFEDAFCLARHRCSCIVLLEYFCPECGKQFNCPANLASHRRWHKPKHEHSKKSMETTNEIESLSFGCDVCGKYFKRQAYLRKHLLTHNKSNSVLMDSVGRQKTNSVSSVSSSGVSFACSTNDGISNKSVCSDESQDSVGLTLNYSSVEFKSNDENEQPFASHRLQVNQFSGLKRNTFTEEENMAAAALAHLRHSQDSVIRHTTTLSI